MSRKFKIRDQEAVHFVAFTTIHWLDPLKRDTSAKAGYSPVVAGIVRHPEDYLYSNAGNYAKLSENLMEVMLI